MQVKYFFLTQHIAKIQQQPQNIRTLLQRSYSKNQPTTEKSVRIVFRRIEDQDFRQLTNQTG
jgi:hypothetical protein